MSLFDGKIVVFDAMVIINFGNLRLVDSVIKWASGEVAVTISVLREADRCKGKRINLSHYIAKGMIIEEKMADSNERSLFEKYLQSTISGKSIHEGEASCLAVAINKNYGLACDEREVREEFGRIKPNSLCLTSRMILEQARDKCYLTEEDTELYIRGLYYM